MTDHQDIKIAYSLLQSLVVDGGGEFLRLIMGTDEDTEGINLALAGSISSPAKVLKQWCISITRVSSPSKLVTLANKSMTEQILVFVPHGATSLVNEPDQALPAVLQAKALAKKVSTLYTRSDLRQNANDNSIFLHLNIPQHAIQAAVHPQSLFWFTCPTTLCRMVSGTRPSSAYRQPA